MSKRCVSGSPGRTVPSLEGPVSPLPLSTQQASAKGKDTYRHNSPTTGLGSRRALGASHSCSVHRKPRLPKFGYLRSVCKQGTS